MVSSIARVISGSSDSGESPSPPSEGDPSLGQRGGVRVGLGSGVWGWCERLNKTTQCRRRVGERRDSVGEVGGGLSEREVACYFIWQNPCASMPSAVLNLLRKFSSATAAVSSTISASVK